MSPEEIEKLIGKEFEWLDQNNRSYKAILADIDPDIGLSVVNADNKDEYLYCLHCHIGYKSYYEENMPSDLKKKSQEKFNKFIDSLTKNNSVCLLDLMDLTDLTDILFDIGPAASSKTCAFNQ